MALIFSRDPVWSQTTRSGFRQQADWDTLELTFISFFLHPSIKICFNSNGGVQVFIMYHSTKQPANVGAILQAGFKISQRGESGNPNLLLGDG